MSKPTDQAPETIFVDLESNVDQVSELPGCGVEYRRADLPNQRTLIVADNTDGIGGADWPNNHKWDCLKCGVPLRWLAVNEFIRRAFDDKGVHRCGPVDKGQG